MLAEDGFETGEEYSV